MDRRIIYDSYIEGNSSGKVYIDNAIDPKTGVRYYLYETTDTHVKFCSAGIENSAYRQLKTYIIYDRYYMFKANIHSEFMGYAVIEVIIHNIDKLPVDYTTDMHIGIDFSECDLSNILRINKKGNKTWNYLLKFPDSSEKRFKPVSIKNLFSGAGNSWINREIRKIDLSYVMYANELFYSSALTSFDFTYNNMPSLKECQRMFWGCVILDSVKGRIGAREINAEEMFYNCIELKHIDDDLFYGCELFRITNIISGCTKLDSMGFLVGKLGGIRNRYMSNFYMYSHMGFHDELIDIVKELLNNGNIVQDSFIYSNKDIYVGKFKCKMGINLYSAFRSRVGLVDLSECEFEYDSDSTMFGVVGMFLKNDIVSHIDDRVVSDNVVNKTVDIIKKDKVEEFPKVIMVNPTIRLSRIDRKLFNVIDMQGVSREDVLAKVNLIKALDTDSSYIIITG